MLSYLCSQWKKALRLGFNLHQGKERGKRKKNRMRPRTNSPLLLLFLGSLFPPAYNNTVAMVIASPCSGMDFFFALLNAFSGNQH